MGFSPNRVYAHALKKVKANAEVSVKTVMQLLSFFGKRENPGSCTWAIEHKLFLILAGIIGTPNDDFLLNTLNSF